MKYWLLSMMIAVVGALAVPSAAAAQDHGEVGAFVDYFRLDRTTPDINFIGVGGRVAFNIRPTVGLEAEMAYDFKRNFTNTFSDGVSTVFVNTPLRPLHALFGPKFQTKGPFKAFVTGKVGFINFSVSNENAPAGFTNAVGGITSGDTRFALYPGGGVEGFWGPFGLRLEVGDEIYFDNGTQNNLRVTFGPQIRF
jgi:opacity protein-like surface antigen